MGTFFPGGINSLAYQGNRASNPPTVVVAKRDPTTSDILWDIGTLWVNEVDDDAFILSSVDGTASWLFIGSQEEGLRTITTPSGTATVSADNLDFAAGGGLNISATGDTVTFQSTGGGLSWNDVTGTSENLVAHNAYQANNGSLVTFTLPATAAFGDVFVVTGWGAGGWRIAQNAGQTITNNLTQTTTGVGGSLSSSNRYDTVWLYCSVANTDFNVFAGKTGGYTIV